MPNLLWITNPGTGGRETLKTRLAAIANLGSPTPPLPLSLRVLPLSSGFYPGEIDFRRCYRRVGRITQLITQLNSQIFNKLATATTRHEPQVTPNKFKNSTKSSWNSVQIWQCTPLFALCSPELRALLISLTALGSILWSFFIVMTQTSKSSSRSSQVFNLCESFSIECEKGEETKRRGGGRDRREIPKWDSCKTSVKLRYFCLFDW